MKNDNHEPSDKRNMFRRLFSGPKSVEQIDPSLNSDDVSATDDVSPEAEDIILSSAENPVTPSVESISNDAEEATRKLEESMKTDEEQVQQSASKNSARSDSANFAGGAAAVVAGVALLTPRPANAWVGDIVDGIVEKAGGAVLEPLKSLFSNLMEGFGLSNMFGTQEGAKAQGRSTDAINEVNHSAENAKVMRATEPPPHLCLNIQERQFQYSVLGKEKVRVKQAQSTYFRDALNYGSGSHTMQIFEKIKQRSAGSANADDTVRTILKVSPIITGSEDTLSEENKQNAILSIDAMVGPAADKIGSPNLKANGSFSANEAKKIGMHNRLAIARNVLVKEVEEKAEDTPGEASRYEARKLMIGRTFGAGSEWYEEVLSKGDMTPLLKDQLVMSGTTNSLMNELLDSSKDTNRLLATQLISTIERA